MNLRASISLFFLLATALTASQAQCIKNLNFHTWSPQGNPLATWYIESDSLLYENGNAQPPTFFICDQEFINVKIRGTMRVETSYDYDFIGFVFAYKTPNNSTPSNKYNFILFDWKAKKDVAFGLEAKEGFHLSKVNKTIGNSEYWEYFWAHKAGTGFEILRDKTGDDLGWEMETDYNFELSYTSSRIIIIIDGETIFNVAGNFEAGAFGFYAFSQQHLLYSNFDYQLDFEFKTEAENHCVGTDIKFTFIDAKDEKSLSNIESVSWDFGDGGTSENYNPSHSYSNAGTYPVTLIVEDEANCIDTTTMEIEIFPYPEIDLPSDTSLDYNASITLNAGNPGADFEWYADKYYWSQEIVLENLTRPMQVDLQVSNNACASTHQLFIDVAAAPEIQFYIPNAFTPNNDGMNDVFLPITKNIDYFEMHIYNRWGGLVFESDNKYNGWNGTRKGKECIDGVYTYIVQVSGQNPESGNTSQTKTGTLVLIR
jgi:gliding motility-associated-like protein